MVRVFRSRHACLAAAAALMTWPGPGITQTEVAPLSIDEVVEFAARQSGQLAAHRAQAIAAREMAAAAGERPDPVLKLGINNLPVEGPDRFSTARDFMTMRSVGLMQELTRAEKRQARADRAALEVGSVAIASQLTLSTLQRDAAMAWLDRSFQETMKSLLQEQKTKAQLQVDAAETLYRSGKGSQAEVFASRAQVEQFADRLLAVQQQIDVATTRLARWIGRPAARPMAARPAFTLPEWTRGDLDRHLLTHPQMAALAQARAIADAELRLASANKRADWSVELMFNQRGSSYSNMVSLNLSVPLQWDQKSRQDREVAARQALVDKAGSEFEDAKRAHLAEALALLREWRSQDERLNRYRAHAVPLAEQRSAASLAAYRAGTGTLPAVLEARRGEVDVRMDALRIEMEQARVWAELNFLLPHPEDPTPAAAPRSTP
jgi:outer membrane protein TolC